MSRVQILAAMLCTTAAGASAFAASPLDGLVRKHLDVRAQRDPRAAAINSLPANNPAEIQKLELQEDQIAAEVARLERSKLTPSDEIDAELLSLSLSDQQALRVCKFERWVGVSHLRGRISMFAAMGEGQPVQTAEQRDAALERWGKVESFLQVEQDNMRAGLASGHTMPRSVVQRSIGQITALLDRPQERSALWSPFNRATDEAFKAQYAQLMNTSVLPALRNYRDFLQNSYAPKTRETLSLSANTDGAACYAALLAFHTTTRRTPAQVAQRGAQIVASNVADVEKIGQEAFGVDDYAAVIRHASAAPQARFSSAEEYERFMTEAVARIEAKTRSAFSSRPAQPVVIQAMPDFLEKAGAQPNYEPQPDTSKPATITIPFGRYASETRGAAEVTAAHEASPGHHLQVALSQEAGGGSKLASQAPSTAYIEGWGRYAERLADEQGAYATPFAKIAMRGWAARGMVADTSLHSQGWSADQTATYLIASGRLEPEAAAGLLDRMAADPGQLAAYDTGADEILSMRKEAQASLGAKFDLAAFHQQILKDGPLPLHILRSRFEAWLSRQKR